MNKIKSLEKYALVLVLITVGWILPAAAIHQNLNIEYNNTGHSSKLAAPMSVNLSVLEISSLNKEVNLMFSVTSLEYAPNSTIQILLPEGVLLVSGDLSWNGNINRNETVKLNASIKVVREGNYIIKATARSYQQDYVFGTTDALFISISEETATVSKKQPVLQRSPMEERIGESNFTYVSNQIPHNSTVTVSGRFLYNDDRGNPQPIKRATVRLFDVDAGVEQELATNTTDDQGNYQFDPVNNVDEDGTTLDIFVRVYANGLVANIVDNNHNTYAFRTNQSNNVSSGPINIGTTTSPVADAGSYNIYSILTEGYKYVTDQGYTPPQVTVIWFPGNTDGTYVDSNTLEIHILGGVTDTDEWDEDVILHEYGHFIMRSVYGEWIPNSGGHHGWNQSVSVSLAFSEGWATFFQSAVQNDEIYTDTSDGSTVLIQHSLELQTPIGEDVEGAVAGTLWDIYDPANEPTDQLALGFDEIWDVLRNYQTNNHHVYNIHEFWDGWFFRCNNNEVEMKSIFNSHGMPDYQYPHAINIISPIQSTPLSAGAYDNPSHIQVTVEARKGDTPITGLIKDNFTIKIGEKTATVSLIDTSIPGRYVFDVTPPQQESPRKYDLEVILNYKGITITDTEQEAVIYTKGKADVMLIIDRSGSMGGRAITDAKNSAKLFTDYMRDGDKEGVVSFASSARYDYHLTELTPEVKTTIKNKIDGIYASGGTAIGYGLRYGYNDLLAYGDVTYPWAMVLLSDGYHNTGEHPNNVLPAIKSQNIKVYTIGLGSYVDKNLMEIIASETGGKYYYSPTSSQLQEIYNSIVGEVIGWGTVLKRSFTILLNQIINIPVWIDQKIKEATFGISWGGSDVDLVLYKPDGSRIDPSVAATDPDIEYVAGPTYKFYRVNNPDPGEWNMEITGKDIPAGGEKVTAIVRASTRLSMSLSTDKDQYNQGETVKITASLTEDGSPIVNANVNANITLPGGSTENIILYDDGGHGDGAANDGVYANYFVNTLRVGDYKIEASATGITSEGDRFSREAEETFKVVQGQGLITLLPDTWTETASTGQQISKTFIVDDPPGTGLFPVNENLYAEYDGNYYLVYNETSIGGEPDYIISANPGPNPQVSKWVSITATSLKTASGDVIYATNITIEPNLLEVPLAGSKQFNATINVPQDAKAGTYSGRIVATAITGSDSIDVTLTVMNGATKLEYIGDLTAQYSDPVTLRAQLNDSGNNNPISGKSINFTLGAQTATATTGPDGIASATLKLNQPAGSYDVKAEFAGDANYSSSNDTKPFSITSEDVNVAYTGDTIVPKSAGSINLRATLNEIDTDYGDLTKVKVNFTIYKSSDLSYSNPVAIVPGVASVSVTSSGTGVGTAQATINNLPVDDYMVIARIVPNDYYSPSTSSPTPLIVYEPTGKFTTGGGWINDSTGSRGSFGFTVRYNKKDKVQGNSVYVYRQNGFDYIVKSNAWIGLAIKGSTSSFQGKAALQIYDPTTGLLQPESSGNFQFTVEAVDNEASGSPDTYKITVLDKDGLVYHSATGELQGGNIVIHEK